MLDRTYTIPLRREYMKVPKYRRAKKAVRAVREFMQKHMKSEDVLVGPKLNMAIWARGIKNPPHHVKVSAIKNDDGEVRVELFGFEFKKKEPKAKAPEGLAGKSQEKLGVGKTEEKKEEVKKEEAEVKKEEPKTAPKKEEKAAPKMDVKKEEPKAAPKEAPKVAPKKDVKKEAPAVKKEEPKAALKKDVKKEEPKTAPKKDAPKKEVKKETPKPAPKESKPAKEAPKSESSKRKE